MKSAACHRPLCPDSPTRHQRRDPAPRDPLRPASGKGRALPTKTKAKPAEDPARRSDQLRRRSRTTPSPPGKGRTQGRARRGEGRALPYNRRRGTALRAGPAQGRTPTGRTPRRGGRRAGSRSRLGGQPGPQRPARTRPAAPSARGRGPPPRPRARGSLRAAPRRSRPGQGRGLPGGKRPESATPARPPAPSLPAPRPRSLPRSVLTALPLPKPLAPRGPPLRRRRHCQGRGAARSGGSAGDAGPRRHRRLLTRRTARRGPSPPGSLRQRRDGRRPTGPGAPSRSERTSPAAESRLVRPALRQARAAAIPRGGPGRAGTAWRMSRRAAAHALPLHW